MFYQNLGVLPVDKARGWRLIKGKSIRKVGVALE